MSKKANPTVIGTFVLGALILAAGAVLLLGSGKFLEPTLDFVMYFEGDLSGLDVGAPVEYRGIRIGSVKEMRLEVNTDTGETLIPVFVQLEPERLTYTGAAPAGQGMQYQIERRGLRAQLDMDSLITGKKKISMIEQAGPPPRLVGKDDSIPEIPTVPTMFEGLRETLTELPVGEIVTNINASLQAISEIMTSGEIRKTVASMSHSSENLDKLMSRLEQTIPQMVSEATLTVTEARQVLADIRPATTNVAPLLVSTRQNVDAFMDIQKDMKATLAEVRSLANERSPVRYELTVALAQIGAAAKSMQELTDYLQRHPEALLAGKRAHDQAK